MSVASGDGVALLDMVANQDAAAEGMGGAPEPPDATASAGTGEPSGASSFTTYFFRTDTYVIHCCTLFF